LHEQHGLAMLDLLTLTHAAKQLPLDVDPASFNPYVGSIDTTSPTF
jgi:hypothetical protein